MTIPFNEHCEKNELRRKLISTRGMLIRAREQRDKFKNEVERLKSENLKLKIKLAGMRK